MKEEKKKKKVPASEYTSKGLPSLQQAGKFGNVHQAPQKLGGGGDGLPPLSKQQYGYDYAAL